MSVVRKDKGNGEAELAVIINKSDYQEKLNEELKKYRQKAHMKGFRPGKVPMSVVRKMYGKAMLADVINNLIQEKMGSYIETEKLDLLGQPLPSSDQELYDFSSEEESEYTFLFDVGLSPEFEVKGVEKSSNWNIPKVDVVDEIIDKEMNQLRKRLGNEIEIEDSIKDGDRLLLNAKELEGDELKKKGFETSFQILVNTIADETLREQVKGMKKGDKFRFDIYEIEPNRTEAHVKKYLLNLEEDEMDKEIGRMFEATISKVSRIAPAEMEPEFFEKAFGEGVVSSEEEARDSLKKQIENYYSRQSEALLFREFQDKLLALNEVKLPEPFLKRWLLASNEDLNEEQLEREYPEFEKNLIWTLIERKVKERYELKVEIDEVKGVLRNQIRQYFGNYPVTDEILDSSVERMMSDQQQFNKAYEEAMSDKVFEAIREHVTITDEMVSLEDFEGLLKAAEASRHAHLQAPSGEEE